MGQSSNIPFNNIFIDFFFIYRKSILETELKAQNFQIFKRINFTDCLNSVKHIS